MAQPLSGIRVLDFTHFMAGPFTSYFLKLLGAEVIKIEPLKGDTFREYGNDRRYTEMGAAFIGANAGKKSIAMDLKKEKARDVVLRLLKTGDIILENFRPGVISKLGFGYDVCKEQNNDIIFCSISGYGQEGPMRDYPAIDNVVQATSGMMSVSGEPGHPPMRIGVPAVDTYTGTIAAIAVLSAVIQRERFGGGQYIDVAMLDSSLVMLYGAVMPYLVSGEMAPRTGNVGFSSQPTSGIFPTADNKLISLGVAQQSAYEKLCHVLKRPELVTDPRFSDTYNRLSNSKELTEIFQEIFLQRPAAEWEKMLSREGLPCGMVRDVASAVDLPQLKNRKLKLPIHIPGLPVKEDIHILNAGFLFEHDGPGHDIPPPRIGQHTREILLDLGFTDKEIGEMEASGIVATSDMTKIKN